MEPDEPVVVGEGPLTPEEVRGVPLYRFPLLGRYAITRLPPQPDWVMPGTVAGLDKDGNAVVPDRLTSSDVDERARADARADLIRFFGFPPRPPLPEEVAAAVRAERDRCAEIADRLARRLVCQAGFKIGAARDAMHLAAADVGEAAYKIRHGD